MNNFAIAISVGLQYGVPLEEFVDACLDLVGPLEFSESTRSELLDQATEDGELNWDTDEDAEKSEKKIGVMLALITASRDFQFA